jgi:uncharacterized protein
VSGAAGGAAGGAGSDLVVHDRPDGVRFAVRVQPRGGRSEIVGLLGGALKVRVAAPPVEGAANAALVALLADALDLPRAAVRIVAGAASRTKLVEVAGVDARRVRRLAAD